MRLEPELAPVSRFASLGKGCKTGFDSVKIHKAGIKVATGPGDSLVEFFVAVVSDDPEELGIAVGAANILGRTATGCVKEKRVDEARDCGFELLDLDRVRPSVAEVIEVLEREGLVLVDCLGEVRGAGISAIGLSIGIGTAIAGAAEGELVKVGIGPAHHDLQDGVQAAEAHGHGDLEAAHYLGLDTL